MFTFVWHPVNLWRINRLLWNCMLCAFVCILHILANVASHVGIHKMYIVCSIYILHTVKIAVPNIAFISHNLLSPAMALDPARKRACLNPAEKGVVLWVLYCAVMCCAVAADDRSEVDSSVMSMVSATSSSSRLLPPKRDSERRLLSTASVSLNRVTGVSTS